MRIRSMNHTTGYLPLLCLLCAFLAGCVPIPAAVAPVEGPTSTSTPTPTSAPTSAPVTDAYWPTAGWRTSPPEEQGIDSAKLAAMVDEINERKIDVHGLLVIRNGYLVSENYFGNRTANDWQMPQSVVKSFVATLVGIALDKGYLKGTDQRVVDLFSDRSIKGLDARKQAMTVEDLLTMRSGLAYEDPGFFASLPTSPDWIQSMLDRPMAEDPGVRWNYCSGCSYLLSAIVQKTSGMKAFDFADQALMKPLGITNYKIAGTRTGDPATGWGLYITPRDMAKLGYLYLRKGQWDGRQIVSADWVERPRRNTPTCP